MKILKALCHLPFVTPAGELVFAPGFHEETGIYSHFEPDALPPVPEAQSRDQVISAIQVALMPWSKFRFATSNDRGAMLAAIITAVCRPALVIAPGFFFDAPVQSSGKTKAAGALGALIKGQRAGITPFVGGPNAEPELSKKLVAMTLIGESFFLVDNVVGTWRSPVLAGLITDGQINERVLGGNQWFRGASRMLITATGNNASLDHDLGRRLIRIRIDPGVECPQSREFPFDPVDAALATRLAISHAVLTLVQAYQSAGSPFLGRGDGGFAEWNRLVRRVVLWLDLEGYAREAGYEFLGDPGHSILEAATADDPDTEAARLLLASLHEEFGGESFTAREAYTLFATGQGEVFEALHAILGRREVTPVSVGRTLLYRRDKIVGGLVLRRAGQNKHGATWSIVTC